MKLLPYYVVYIYTYIHTYSFVASVDDYRRLKHLAFVCQRKRPVDRLLFNYVP